MTSADGSSSGVCVLTCSDAGGEESVKSIDLDALSKIKLLLNIFGPCRKKTWRLVRLIISTLFLGADRWYGEVRGLKLMWVSSIKAYIASGQDCCSHKHGDFLDGTLWHCNNSGHLPRREPKTLAPNNMLNNCRQDIGWNDYHFGLARLFAYNDGLQLNMISTNEPHCLWGNWGNQHPRQRNLTVTGHRW